MEHILVIPTHRYIEPALTSLIKEAELYSSSKIMIVDNGSSEIAALNRSYIKNLIIEKQIPIIYVDLSDIRELCDRIVEITGNDSLLNLLYPDSFDYGKIFNIIYLLVIREGANTFHRRDSDCFVDNLAMKEYPIVSEMKYLGESISNISDEIDICEKDYVPGNEELLIVGSDYYGAWNLDLDILEKGGKDSLVKFLELMGIPGDQIQLDINAKYTHVINKLQRPVLKTSWKVREYPECGNVAMKDVFRYIPNFIGEYGIGFDYHTYFMSFLFNVPILFHTNKIVHKHDSSRKDYNALKQYWIGIIKQIDLNVLLTGFIQKELPALLDGISEFQVLDRLSYLADEGLVNSFERVLSTVDREARSRKVNELIESVLLPSGIIEYENIAQFLLNKKDDILNELDNDYRNSLELQKNWRDIVRAVESLR